MSAEKYKSMTIKNPFPNLVQALQSCGLIKTLKYVALLYHRLVLVLVRKILGPLSIQIVLSKFQPQNYCPSPPKDLYLKLLIHKLLYFENKCSTRKQHLIHPTP